MTAAFTDPMRRQKTRLRQGRMILSPEVAATVRNLMRIPGKGQP